MTSHTQYELTDWRVRAIFNPETIPPTIQMPTKLDNGGTIDLQAGWSITLPTSHYQKNEDGSWSAWGEGWSADIRIHETNGDKEGKPISATKLLGQDKINCSGVDWLGSIETLVEKENGRDAFRRAATLAALNTLLTCLVKYTNKQQHPFAKDLIRTIVHRFDRTRTLTELEDKDWGVDGSGSPLYATLHQLRYKPLRDFTAEDLRVMICQNISLNYLIPPALDLLETNPLAEGNYYKGDLLCNVLKAEPRFFRRRKDLKERVDNIVNQAQENPDVLNGKFIQQLLNDAVLKYRSQK